MLVPLFNTSLRFVRMSIPELELVEGLGVRILRSNGRIHLALVRKVNWSAGSVAVEWQRRTKRRARRWTSNRSSPSTPTSPCHRDNHLSHLTQPRRLIRRVSYSRCPPSQQSGASIHRYPTQTDSCVVPERSNPLVLSLTSPPLTSNRSSTGPSSRWRPFHSREETTLSDLRDRRQQVLPPCPLQPSGEEAREDLNVAQSARVK